MIVSVVFVGIDMIFVQICIVWGERSPFLRHHGTFHDASTCWARQLATPKEMGAADDGLALGDRERALGLVLDGLREGDALGLDEDDRAHRRARAGRDGGRTGELADGDVNGDALGELLGELDVFMTGSLRGKRSFQGSRLVQSS